MGKKPEWWHVLSVSLDNGRGGRQRPRPCLGYLPSLLWSHQIRCGGVHLSFYQNISEQNLPCVPGQEKAQEDGQECVRGQCNTLVMAETAVSVPRKRTHLRFLHFSWSPVCAAASCDAAYYFWTEGSAVCEPGQLGGCIVLVNRVWQL